MLIEVQNMDEVLLRYFSGELTLEERLELSKLVEKDESLKEEFICLQNLNAAYQLVPEKGDKNEGVINFETFKLKLKRNNQKKVLKRFLRYTAVAVILIASTAIITLHLEDKSTGLDNNTLHVPAGQRAQITLQDGTEVWLNAQSILKYPSRFPRKNRKVEVEGEAYFKVAKNKRKPFIVFTQYLDIDVLGTEFNIHSYPDADYVQTALVKGSLSVHKTGDESTTVTLKPNEQLTFKDNRMTIAPIYNPDHLLWRNGIYSFSNERLINILEKLELYYDITIRVEDPEIFEVRYTGKFRQSDGIDEILRLLQKIQPFKIIRDRDKNLITLSK